MRQSAYLPTTYIGVSGPTQWPAQIVNLKLHVAFWLSPRRYLSTESTACYVSCRVAWLSLPAQVAIEAVQPPNHAGTGCEVDTLLHT